MFYCNTGRCIPAELKCDRFNHCEDNSDESNDNCLSKAFCWMNQIASALVYKLSIFLSLLMMYKNFTLEFLHKCFFLWLQIFGTKIGTCMWIECNLTFCNVSSYTVSFTIVSPPNSCASTFILYCCYFTSLQGFF